jgi:uncharacterized phage protein (TIGR02220 family)
MSKDPAFLFYPKDFYMGTIHMSDEELGQYIRLLCIQHDSGHIDAMAMRRHCGGNPTALVLSKFQIDSEGKYFNQRLEDEIIKRRAHSEKQKANAGMRWHKSGISQNDAKGMPLENTNANGIENELEDVNELEKNAREILIQFNSITGRNFDHTNKHALKFVKGRLSDGHTSDDLIGVAKYKFNQWKDDEKMKEYLRPKTIYAAANFYNYLVDMRETKTTAKNGHDPRYPETFVFDKA